MNVSLEVSWPQLFFTLQLNWRWNKVKVSPSGIRSTSADSFLWSKRSTPKPLWLNETLIYFYINFGLISAQFTFQLSLKQCINMSRIDGSYANVGLTCWKLHSLAYINKPHFTPTSNFSDSGHRQVEHRQCGGVPGHLSDERRLWTTRSRTSSSLNIV